MRPTTIAPIAPSAPPPVTPVPRLQALPLLWRVLLVNTVIVVVGAIVGTALTARVARAEPTADMVRFLVVSAIVGVAVSVTVNLLALRATLRPLTRLQAVIDAVRTGDRQARVETEGVGDPQMARVGETLNQMLDELARVEERLRGLSNAVITAQEEERRRVARELHDDVAQTLTSMLLYAKAIEQTEPSPAVREALAELREAVSESLASVRRMARELRPSALDDLGLVEALAGFTQEFARRTGLAVHFEPACGGDRLPADVEVVLYRIAQEAVTNAAKHADPHHITVGLVREPGGVSLTVEDDGRGFHVAATGTGSTHMGLFSMRERAALVGGTLQVRSAPGAGTAVFAWVPLRGLRAGPAQPAGR